MSHRPATSIDKQMTAAHPGAFRHVIFDLDGTLFDTAPDILLVLTAALRHCGYDGHPTTPVVPGRPLDEMVRAAVGRDIPAASVQQIAAEFRRQYDQLDFSRTRDYPGAIDLLRRLKAVGSHLHIATNKREVPTRRLLQAKGVLELFTEIVCVDTGGARWSKRQMLERILRAEEAKPDECVFVGDAVSDIQAGHELGLKTVGVLYGYGTAQEISEARPDWLCESMQELL